MRPKLFAPPPPRHGKTFRAPLLTSGNFFCPLPPPFNMAKTSSYSAKTTPKLVVPPFGLANTFSAPHSFIAIGVKLHAPPPSHFIAPLPIISDQSIMSPYQLIPPLLYYKSTGNIHACAMTYIYASFWYQAQGALKPMGAACTFFIFLDYIEYH